MTSEKTELTSIPTVIKEENKLHGFNVPKIVKAFENKKILCSAIRPEIDKTKLTSDEFKKIALENKVNQYFPILSKADIIILDWEFFEGDQKGEFTQGLLKKFYDELEKLRLIIIYTGTDVRNNVLNVLQTLFEIDGDIKEIEDKECVFEKKGLRVKVVLKNETTTQKGDLNIKQCSEEELSEVCLNEFAIMTQGLITNTTLKAITTIRDNTYSILSKFNSTLDAPFLTHRAFLPCPEDSEYFITESIGQEISSLIHNLDVYDVVNIENIEKWLSHNEINNLDITYKKNDDNFLTENKTAKEIFEKGIPTLIKLNNSSETKKCLKKTVLTKQLLKLSDSDMFKSIPDKELSVITSIQSNYKNVPFLTQGIILKKEENSCSVTNEDLCCDCNNNDNTYYLCIQQKCDCHRIEDEGRTFLFLPLKEKRENDNFDIIIKDNEYKYLKLVETYNLVLKKFTPDSNNGKIIAKKESVNNKYYFETCNNEKFDYISILKPIHAQKISNKIAGNLSRVGLDDTEWFRLHQG